MGLLLRLSVVGAMISIGTCFYLVGPEVFVLVSTLYLYALVMIGYFFVYAAFSRSVSITLMIQLAGFPDSTQTFDFLREQYEVSSRFESRIELMRDAGFLRMDGDCVEITRKGRILVRATKVLAACLGTIFEG